MAKIARIVIRMNAARHDATIGTETVDLSKMFTFGKSRQGYVVPTKDADLVSSKVIADCQSRGMFVRA